MRKRARVFSGLLFFVFIIRAQTPSFALYQGAGTTIPILNGGSIPVTTTASAINYNGVKIKNLGAITVSLSVIRTIVFNSPTLNVTPTSKPSTCFCFGNACFPNYISTVTGADYTILLPAGNTDTVFPYSDDSDYNNQPFKIYLEEGSVEGKYYVSYKVFNINNANDSIRFTIKYNDFLGVNNYVASEKFISEAFPDPANDNVRLVLDLEEKQEVKIRVSNELGQVIYEDIERSIKTGKQELVLNTSGWSPGMYYINIIIKDSSLNRKLIISR